MKTKRKSTKKPSPAQLAARAKFVKMVRARAAAAKKAKRNSRGFSGAAPSWTKVKTRRKSRAKNPRGKYARVKRSYEVESSFSKKPIKVKAHSEREAIRKARATTDRHLVQGKTASRIYGAKRAVRKTRKVVKRAGSFLKSLFNPGGQHLPGLPLKYQRMYEDILASSGSKRIAAATTKKEFARQNPSLFGRLFGKTRKPSAAQRRARAFERVRRQKLVARRQHGRGNPSPASVFSEFRGKNATTKTKATAAKGTPTVLAKLGGLQELHVRGKRLRFNGRAALAADGRKKLHIVGVKFARPNPPGEVDYGEILSVVYVADKNHIEPGTFNYKHHFGEDGGKRPHLIVDEEGYPVIEGGSYRITSDGIID